MNMQTVQVRLDFNIIAPSLDLSFTHNSLPIMEGSYLLKIDHWYWSYLIFELNRVLNISRD